MSFRLSLLDKSPVAEGVAAEEALRTSLAYADLADRLGYHRFWTAEHHGSPLNASAAPEALAAHLLARTRRIRIGTGGVLIQHYSPYKLAEVFGLLAALAPGRVDLGIGRSPGGLPRATEALRPASGGVAASVDDKLAQLEAFLNAPSSGDPEAESPTAYPRPARPPDRFLLGSSVEAARTAARLGWGFVHAGHQDGDPEAVDRTLEAYGSRGPRPILAVTAFAAATREEALALAERRSFKAWFSDGYTINVGGLEAVEAHARELGRRPLKVEERRPQTLAGTPEEVRAGLEALARRHGVEEFILDSPVAEREPRLRSIELIAAVRRLAAA